MILSSFFRVVGNKVYDQAFPIYRVCYGAFKAYADRAERQLLKEILSYGSVVVDAGANIGIYSEFLSRCVGASGLVHSFEPSPENFRRLQAATRKLSNVRVCQSALGERSGRSKLYVSSELNVDHRTYATEGDSRRIVPVEIIALDDYFKPGQRVDLIKMDIQGYELHALRGGERVVRENPDIKLLLEFWPYGLAQAGAKWEELIEILHDFSMSVMVVQKKGLVPFAVASISMDKSWYVNLFASRG